MANQIFFSAKYGTTILVFCFGGLGIIPFLVEISTLLDMISNEFLRFWTLNFFYKN